MKKVININFQGTVVPIEEDAYETLQKYIESLRRHFVAEEGHDEIINDIETRISELFQNHLKDGVTCITMEHVNKIIDNMGRPEDLDDAEGSSDNSKENTSSSAGTGGTYSRPQRLYRDETKRILGGVCSGIGIYIGIDPWIVRILFIISGLGLIAYILLWIFLPSNNSRNDGIVRKLYRNPDDKVIGGVCGGIGSYFNISSWIPRIIFLLPLFSFFNHIGTWFIFPHFTWMSFGSGTFLLYIILWIVVPLAKTTSEKLEMKGERVDLNSIKESVSRELKETGQRIKEAGKEAGDFVQKKSSELRSEFSSSANNRVGWLGNAIVAFFKVILYIILGSVGFAVLITLFILAVTAVGIFPLKDFIVASGIQNVLAWLTLIFFIGVPIVGTITFIIRRLSRRKSSGPYFKWAWAGLWIFGWISLFALLSFVGKDFSYQGATDEQTIQLANPDVEFLEVNPMKETRFPWKGKLSFGIWRPFTSFGITNDTALLPLVRLNIVKSPDDLFQIRYIKMSNGYSVEDADNRASKTEFSGYQDGSKLYLDNVIPINTHDKFRNQSVDVAVMVPVGDRVKINKGIYRRGKFYRINISGVRTSTPRNYDGFDFNYGTEYIMKEDGLHRVDTSDTENSQPDESYRHRRSDGSAGRDRESQIESLEKSLDSVKRLHEKELKRFQDSLLKKRDEIDKKLNDINVKASLIRDKDDDIFIGRGQSSFFIFM